MLDAGDLLEGLVALPEEEDDVAGPGETRRAADRVAPVELDAHTRPLRAGDAAEHRADDLARDFRARIIGREDRNVGGGESRAHLGPLRCVAVSSTAADHDH